MSALRAIVVDDERLAREGLTAELEAVLHSKAHE